MKKGGGKVLLRCLIFSRGFGCSGLLSEELSVLVVCNLFYYGASCTWNNVAA